MATTRNTVFVAADPKRVFEITNAIERWPDLFEEYVEAKILGRVGNKVTFQLVNREKKSWRSSRFIFEHDLVAVAEREEPKFPFLHMHLLWTYREVPGGTEMTWVQEFEPDPEAPVNEDQMVRAINEHSRANQQRIKHLIEAGTL